ncbi:MAG TPA: hypothetical protein VFT50_18220 [Baekduia sp.]|nr:hypothetical protein [Baekduia sp.]
MVDRLLRDPLWLLRLGVRALDDLHTLAEATRQPPPWVRDFGRRLDALHGQLGAAIPLIGELVALGTELRDLGRHVEVRARELRDEGRELLDAGRRLHATGEALLDEGRRLATTGTELLDEGGRLGATGKALAAEGRQLRDRGDTLVAREEALSATAERVEHLTGDLLEQLRMAMRFVPAATEALERLQGPAETMAETVEPLEGAAAAVGRATRRLRRGDQR